MILTDEGFNFSKYFATKDASMRIASLIGGTAQLTEGVTVSLDVPGTYVFNFQIVEWTVITQDSSYPTWVVTTVCCFVDRLSVFSLDLFIKFLSQWLAEPPFADLLGGNV